MIIHEIERAFAKFHEQAPCSLTPNMLLLSPQKYYQLREWCFHNPGMTLADCAVTLRQYRGVDILVCENECYIAVGWRVKL